MVTVCGSKVWCSDGALETVCVEVAAGGGRTVAALFCT